MLLEGITEEAFVTNLIDTQNLAFRVCTADCAFVGLGSLGRLLGPNIVGLSHCWKPEALGHRIVGSKHCWVPGSLGLRTVGSKHCWDQPWLGFAS